MTIWRDIEEIFVKIQYFSSFFKKVKFLTIEELKETF